MTNIKDHLSYDPETGIFVWTHPLSNRVKQGAVATYIDKDGYCGLRFNKKYYRAHRLAYWWLVGVWPKAIDHINGDKQDNRFVNLRAASYQQNNQNKTKPRSDNTTGWLGVCFNAGRYVAYIGHENKTYYLGRFISGEEAHQAYVLSKRKLHEYGTL
jgi:hypothetical protein